MPKSINIKFRFDRRFCELWANRAAMLIKLTQIEPAEIVNLNWIYQTLTHEMREIQLYLQR